ncbi:hypothetical protein C7Y66_22765 [Chroococcidiopsis sp. CCALA 051]|nr:hypothetical protein C7Y66_22765 [Chroococcidiopsis sp. CCALA 051]
MIGIYYLTNLTNRSSTLLATFVPLLEPLSVLGNDFGFYYHFYKQVVCRPSFYTDKIPTKSLTIKNLSQEGGKQRFSIWIYAVDKQSSFDEKAADSRTFPTFIGLTNKGKNTELTRFSFSQSIEIKVLKIVLKALHQPQLEKTEDE